MLSLNDLNKAHEEFYYLQDFTLNSLYYDTDENITETTDNFIFRDVKTDEQIVCVNTHFETFDIFIDNAIVDNFLFSEMIERYVWDRQDFAERVLCDDNDVINSFTRNEQYTKIQVALTAKPGHRADDVATSIEVVCEILKLVSYVNDCKYTRYDFIK